MDTDWWNRYLVVALFAYSAIVTAQLLTFHTQVTYNQQEVYDVVIRNTRAACLHGTWYPPEWREVKGFNRNSPTYYCSRYIKKKEPDILDFINRKIR